MINERERHIWRPIWAITGLLRRTAVPVASGGETMDALTATIIAVGGSLIVIVISQIQNRRTRRRSDSSAGSDSGVYAGGDDSGSLFLAGAMAVMADPALALVLTLAVEATAAEVMAGEAATAVVAEAISGRRCLSGPAWPLNYSRSFF